MDAKFALEFLLGNKASLLAKHIKLLKAVDETKSITKAAEIVGVSYKNGWDALNLINNASKKPLIVRTQGTKKNSGSELTPYAHKLIRAYDAISHAGEAFLGEILKLDEITEESLLSLEKIGMKLSARNQLSVEITDVQTGAVNSQITAKLAGGEILCATVTVESEKNLGLKAGKDVLFLFKAPSVIIAKGSSEKLKLSTANQIKGTISEVKIGAVNAEICLGTSSHQNITAIITRESATAMALGVGDEVTAIIEPSEIIIGA